ncbi:MULTISPECIES: beta-propeller fold lactonase family protein [unclassified Actinotalea]|uniref:lactonase family protein n=1 Tax=unclassified Actinotalea TaxID=2638618 RepID=UPI0015F38CB2|nr:MULTISPECIES: beta-propeller fold lactonase family protein [unclassified Actinotalea]
MSAPALVPDPSRLWLGGYPADGPGGRAGTGEGIWHARLDPGTGALEARLAAATPTPAFLALAPDGRTLYAAAEQADGSLTAFAVGPDGALTERHRIGSGGGWPCHLLVDPQGRALYATNYATGDLVVVPLAADGGFTAEVVAGGLPAQSFPHRGSGPRADRQEGPHAHSAVLVPGGRLLVADLGTDELRRFRVRDDGSLVEDGVAHRFAPGTGPRHVAVVASADGPCRLYVAGELSATVHVLAWDAASGAARELQAVPACASPPVTGDALYPAHVVVDGDRVVVSVRGADVLATFAVGPDGLLEHLGDVAVGGAWPRHFALVDGWAVVAAQGSARVTALAWDGAAPGPVAGSVDVPHPACVLPG